MTDHIHMHVSLAQLDYDLNWKEHVTESHSNLSSDIMSHVFFNLFRIGLSLGSYIRSHYVSMSDYTT